MHGISLDDIKSFSGLSFNHIIGMIDKEEALRFKRMVFRVTKGNCYTDFIDIDDSL